jgi:hypothetical protein
MERRLAALEEALAARSADDGVKNADAAAATSDGPRPAEIRWPHMADNIFLASPCW